MADMRVEMSAVAMAAQMVEMMAFLMDCLSAAWLVVSMAGQSAVMTAVPWAQGSGL